MNGITKMDRRRADLLPNKLNKLPSLEIKLKDTDKELSTTTSLNLKVSNQALRVSKKNSTDTPTS